MSKESSKGCVRLWEGDAGEGEKRRRNVQRRRRGEAERCEARVPRLKRMSLRRFC